MVNAVSYIGNGHLIPCGPLREPLTALQRADAVVLHHADLVSLPLISPFPSLAILFSGKPYTLRRKISLYPVLLPTSEVNVGSCGVLRALATASRGDCVPTCRPCKDFPNLISLILCFFLSIHSFLVSFFVFLCISFSFLSLHILFSCSFTSCLFVLSRFFHFPPAQPCVENNSFAHSFF
jgi:hypothetical protein